MKFGIAPIGSAWGASKNFADELDGPLFAKTAWYMRQTETQRAAIRNR